MALQSVMGPATLNCHLVYTGFRHVYTPQKRLWQVVSFPVAFLRNSVCQLLNTVQQCLNTVHTCLYSILENVLESLPPARAVLGVYGRV